MHPNQTTIYETKKGAAMDLQISLEAARVNAKLTQAEAAEKIGVSRQTIINWEKGKVIPRIPEMKMLSLVYNIPQDNIFLPYTLQKVD